MNNISFIVSQIRDTSYWDEVPDNYTFILGVIALAAIYYITKKQDEENLKK